MPLLCRRHVRGLLDARHCAERNLGHSPRLAHGDAEPLVASDERGGNRRSRADHPLEWGEWSTGAFGESGDAAPQRRHACGKRDALGVDRPEHVGRLQIRPRQHELRPDHRADVRHAPARGVEQRHRDEDRIALAEREAVDSGHEDRGVGERAVAVENPLGVARRTGGVAEQRRLGLGTLREAKLGIAAVDQILVAQQRCEGRRRQRSVTHDDVRFDVRQLRRDRLEHRHQAVIDEDHPIVGVRCDPGELVGVQAEVEGVQDAARPGNRVVELDVAAGVPGERRHPVERVEAHPVERRCQTSRAAADLPPGRSANRIGRARHHLAVAEVALGSLEQRREPQRRGHHQSVHFILCVLCVIGPGSCLQHPVEAMREPFEEVQIPRSSPVRRADTAIR